MSESLFKQIIESMPCALLVWRFDHTRDRLKLSFFNQKATEYTGIGPENEEQTVGRFLDLEASQKLISVSKKVLDANKPVVLSEFKIKKNKDEVVVFSLHAQPLNQDYVAVYLYKKYNSNSAATKIPKNPLSNLISKLEVNSSLKKKNSN